MIPPDTQRQARRHNALMNEYQPHPLLQQAVDVYLRYYERTEAFDRFYCQARSPHTGHALPISADERRICSQNAREQVQFAERELDALGVPRDVRKRGTAYRARHARTRFPMTDTQGQALRARAERWLNRDPRGRRGSTALQQAERLIREFVAVVEEGARPPEDAERGAIEDLRDYHAEQHAAVVAGLRSLLATFEQLGDDFGSEQVLNRAISVITDLQAAKDAAAAQVEGWRKWIQFVWLGGGPVVDDDETLKFRACAEHDRLLREAKDAAAATLTERERQIDVLRDMHKAEGTLREQVAEQLYYSIQRAEAAEARVQELEQVIAAHDSYDVFADLARENRELKARVQALEQERENLAIACFALWDDPVPAAFALVEGHVCRAGVAKVEEMRGKALPRLRADLQAAEATLRELRAALTTYGQHKHDCRFGKPVTVCPICLGSLKPVVQSANSPLNEYQFNAVKAGDYYCTLCKGDEGNTPFKYWWARELQKQGCDCGFSALLTPAGQEEK